MITEYNTELYSVIIDVRYDKTKTTLVGQNYVH